MVDVTSLHVEVERETDGRWIAEVPALPGALAYGNKADEAKVRAKELAAQILADRREIGESVEDEQ